MMHKDMGAWFFIRLEPRGVLTKPVDHMEFIVDSGVEVFKKVYDNFTKRETKDHIESQEQEIVGSIFEEDFEKELRFGQTNLVYTTEP